MLRIVTFQGIVAPFSGSSRPRRVLIGWSRVLQKLTGLQLVKKFDAFYGTRRFIIAVTSSRQLSLSWAIPKYQSRSENLSVNISQQGTFWGWGVVSTWPNPQDGGPPLVGCPRLFIQHIRSYPPYWRPLLHPQPEDAPCCGDRDPLVTWDKQMHSSVKPFQISGWKC